jgi:hypothetical protein
MNPKYRYLYIIIGSILLVMLIARIVMTYPEISAQGVLLDALPSLVFYYLAYKTYHEKKDNELM